MGIIKRLFQFSWRAQAIVYLVFAIPFGIVFAGIGAWFGVQQISESIENKKIVKNGVEIEATVTGIDEAKKAGMYNVTYEYQHDGQTKQGKSDASFEKLVAERMTTIKIYLYEGEEYDKSIVTQNEGWTAIFSLPFIAFGIYAIIGGIIETIRIFKATKINKNNDSVISSGSANNVNEPGGSGIVIKCPACGRMTELNNIGFCPLCNTLVNEEMFNNSKDKDIKQVTETTVNNFCTNCGAKVNDGASFCTQCGTKINK